jgi:hypothetical protein
MLSRFNPTMFVCRVCCSDLTVTTASRVVIIALASFATLLTQLGLMATGLGDGLGLLADGLVAVGIAYFGLAKFSHLTLLRPRHPSIAP